MMIVGCGKSLTEEEKIRDSIGGEYELKDEDGDTYKLVFLDNYLYESYLNGKTQLEVKWKITNGEIHVDSSVFIQIFRPNKDKSITEIAWIEDGKRTDYLKEEQWTFKKIK